MNRRTYTMVGAGGTGSFLFQPLLRYLESHRQDTKERYLVLVIDGKTVAASKLERQMFFSKMTGLNKAEAIIAQYEISPDVAIAMPSYLNETSISQINDGDTVMIAADNFPVRARIERRASQLQNITVINGGNELIDGSVQIWVRRNGVNITPPLSQGHPELLEETNDDPAELSCQQLAELPGGGQTIMANMMSAVAMLNALRIVHQWEKEKDSDDALPIPEEAYFDLSLFAMRSDNRPQDLPTSVTIEA